VVIFPPVPSDTAKVARAVLDGNNFYLAVGSQIDRLFSGLVQNSPTQPIQMPFRMSALLYLITIFQFYEALSDDLAVEAIRKRVDWKYALHLPLNYPGMKASSLCEFRQWLLVDHTGKLNLTTLISRLSEGMIFGAKQRSLPETDQIIMQVCLLTRLARIWDTFHQSIEALAAQRADWLHNVSLPHWYVRYSYRNKMHLWPNDQEKWEAGALAIGADIQYLLAEIEKSQLPILTSLPEVQLLRQAWEEQFEEDVNGESYSKKMRWRLTRCASCTKD
jgi:transposase